MWFMIGAMRALIDRLRRAIGLDEIDLSNLAEDPANRLRRLQIRGAIEQMRVFVAGNTFFAPVLALQAWNLGINWVVVTWAALMLGFSWWLFAHWRTAYHTDGSEDDMQRFVNQTKVNATLWCLGFVLVYPVVTGDQKTVVLVVVTGALALATVGFAQAPRAAFWYLGITTATLGSVTFMSGWSTGNPYDYLISGLAVFAGGAIFNTVLEHARSQMRAFTTHEDLSQKTEVVDLLLKDYEEQSVEWVWRTNSKGQIVTCPERIVEMLVQDGMPLDEVGLLDALRPICDSVGDDDLNRLDRAFTKRLDFHDVMLPLVSAGSGLRRWIMMRGRAQFENGRFAGFRGIFVDATARVEAQRQVEFLAENDPLTGIANRNTVQRHLEALDPKSDHAVALLIDLDGFKQVNDSYGHSVGDKLLQQVSERLRTSVAGRGLVARLGGDEFLVLLTLSDSFDRGEAGRVADQILNHLSRPFVIDHFDIALSASIGTAAFPHDTDHGEGLMNLADLALYTAKKGGRNRAVAFVHKMQTGQQKRLMLTNKLRQAVEDGLIEPYFQPQYCSQTRRLVGFEALARWNDPELGVVGPDIFIPLAEETGLIHQMGESVMREACLQALDWIDLRDPESSIRVSVNASPVQVQRGGLVKIVRTVLSETGLPPHLLEIEVTESVLIEDIASTRNTLARLAELGVTIALDDFGTGYSSLSYLRALPLHRLKIDRSFVRDIVDDPEAVSVVQSIVDLCRRLGLEVVAEGVESEEIADLLEHLHRDVLQGYHFSRPLPADEAVTTILMSDDVAA